MTRVLIASAACLILAGCGGTPVDVPNLKAPSKWLMATPCKLPVYPKEDGDPVARANYDAELRKCAARRADQAKGLQQYAKAVVKAANKE
jgi:hypothetical protein